MLDHTHQFIHLITSFYTDEGHFVKTMGCDCGFTLRIIRKNIAAHKHNQPRPKSSHLGPINK